MGTILKCKMCGGDIELKGAGIGVCQYCGSAQVVPKTSDEKKLSLIGRAEHYRAINEFDRALNLYEQLIIEDADDAEIYWDIVLCEYGIEYVEDPRTHAKVPTVNRAQYVSIFDNSNYQKALAIATAEQKALLESEAKRIDEIQKRILSISENEEPYDIFICYKETDDKGQRTEDSVLAQDIYTELVKENYRVFFSRITLESVIGNAYEPYIFSALNSAKVMIVVGTSTGNYNAVWVKNEWSRYLTLANKSENKTLIPTYKNMDVYDLPEELAYLQAQDLGKIGYLQDLLRGVKKIIQPEILDRNQAERIYVDVEKYRERVNIFLTNGEFARAKEYCEKILDSNPCDADAYCKLLFSECQVANIDELKKTKKSFAKNKSYQNALKYGSQSLREELEHNLKIVEQTEKKRKRFALVAFGIVVFLVVFAFLLAFSSQNSRIISQAEICIDAGDVEGAEEILSPYLNRKSISNSKANLYLSARKKYKQGDYEGAKNDFEHLNDYKDSKSWHIICCGALVFEEDYQSFIERSTFIPSISLLTESVGLSNKEAIDEFKSYNQERWYDDAINISNYILENSRTIGGRIDLKVNNISKLMDLCGGDYKDVNLYKELIEQYGKRGGYFDSELLIENANEIPLAKIILWQNYPRWLEGTWKDSRDYYFTLEVDGQSYQTHYNMPYFDIENNFFEIDLNGIYYISTQDGSITKDMYRFNPITSNELEVYCYKDGSTYTLYKQ